MIFSTTYSYKTYCQQQKRKTKGRCSRFHQKYVLIFTPYFFTICANHNLLLQSHHHSLQNVHFLAGQKKMQKFIFHTSTNSHTSHRPSSFIGHWGHKLCATKQNFTTILVYKCAFFVTTISHTVLLFTRLGHHAFALLLSTFPKFLI